MHDRIFSSPVEIRSIILSILVSSTVVSFLQTSILLVFSSIILGGAIFPPSLPLVLLVLLISVVFNQLFGTVLLLLTGGGVKTANMVTTIYGSIVPMTVGLYFPLPPQTEFFRILRLYGTLWVWQILQVWQLWRGGSIGSFLSAWLYWLS